VKLRLRFKMNALYMQKSRVSIPARNMLSFVRHLQTGSGPHILTTTWYHGVCSGIMQPEHGADLSVGWLGVVVKTLPLPTFPLKWSLKLLSSSVVPTTSCTSHVVTKTSYHRTWRSSGLYSWFVIGRSWAQISAQISAVLNVVFRCVSQYPRHVPWLS
jgi:hypothetical protein